MTTTELRKKAKLELEELDEPRLRSVLDFISYLRDRESHEATEELLRIPGFMDSFKRGLKDVAGGRTTPWRKARKNV